MSDIVIYGASVQGECTFDVVTRHGLHRIVGFLDDGRTAGTEVCGLPVLGGGDDLVRLRAEHGFVAVIVGLGDNFARSQVVERLTALDPTIEFATAIDPSAVVGSNVTIGDGSVLMAGAVVNIGATLGRHTLLCARASLDHHSTLGDFASLAPTVATGGRVSIGDRSAICIGATVNHGITVGAHTVVGAGSTVVSDIADHVVAYGTPARVVRTRAAGDAYL